MGKCKHVEARFDGGVIHTAGVRSFRGCSWCMAEAIVGILNTLPDVLPDECAKAVERAVQLLTEEGVIEKHAAPSTSEKQAVDPRPSQEGSGKP